MWRDAKPTQLYATIHILFVRTVPDASLVNEPMLFIKIVSLLSLQSLVNENTNSLYHHHRSLLAGDQTWPH